MGDAADNNGLKELGFIDGDIVAIKTLLELKKNRNMLFDKTLYTIYGFLLMNVFLLFKLQ